MNGTEIKLYDASTIMLTKVDASIDIKIDFKSSSNNGSIGIQFEYAADINGPWSQYYDVRNFDGITNGDNWLMILSTIFSLRNKTLHPDKIYYLRCKVVSLANVESYNGQLIIHGL